MLGGITIINAKHLFFLLIFIVALCAVSQVSAQDAGNLTSADGDSLQADQSEGIVSDDAVAEDNVVNVENTKTTKSKASIKVNKLTTTYGVRKYLKIRVTDSKTKKPISNVKLALKVFTGKKSKKITLKTDSKGIAKYSAAKLKAGKHKVKIAVKSSNVTAKAKATKITVKKAAIRIYAPGGVHSPGHSELNIPIENKHTKAPIKAMKLKVKVYTGKRYRVYSVKTASDGFASIKMYFAMGKHKIVVSAKGNANYRKCTVKSVIDVNDDFPPYVGNRVNR